jgi:hypothetical protein
MIQEGLQDCISNFVASFKHHLGGGYIDSPRVTMITFRSVVSLDKF